MLVVVNTAVLYSQCELNSWFITGKNYSVTLIIMWRNRGLLFIPFYCQDRWHNNFGDGLEKWRVFLYLLYWDGLCNHPGDCVEK
jgi:hypothetical protein